MSAYSWQETLAQAEIDGTTLTNTVTATSIIPTAARCVLTSGFINRTGKTLRIRASGRISSAASAAITFSVRMGPTSNIIVATSPSLALNATAKVNVPWVMEWSLTARSVGSGTTATLMHTGQWVSEAVVGSAAPAAGGSGAHQLTGNPAVGTGFDSTVDNVVDLFATWGAASASNSIQVVQYALESIN